MTVLRLSSGTFSCTPRPASTLGSSEAHGSIRHLVAPNIAHWSFLWQRQCPDAVTWAAPGLRERSLPACASTVTCRPRARPSGRRHERARGAMKQGHLPEPCGSRNEACSRSTWQPASYRCTRAPLPELPACSRPTGRPRLTYGSSLSAAPLPRARPHAVALDPERVHLRAWTLVRAQRRRAVAAIIPLAFALIGRAGTGRDNGEPLCKQRDSRRGPP